MNSFFVLHPLAYYSAQCIEKTNLPNDLENTIKIYSLDKQYSSIIVLNISHIAQHYSSPELCLGNLAVPVLKEN